MSTPRTGIAASAPDRRAPARVTGRELLAGVAWALLIAVVLCGGTWAVVGRLAPGWDGQALTVLLVAEGYLAISAGLTIGVGGPAGVRDKLALRAVRPGRIAAALGVWVLAAAVTGLVYLGWGAVDGDPPALIASVVRAGSDADRLPTATTTVLVLILVRVGVLTGLAEELLFRGALYGWLRLRLSPTTTVLVTSALFVLEHGGRWVLLPLVLCLGLAAGIVRHRSGSTLATLLMHVLTDLGLLAAAVALT